MKLVKKKNLTYDNCYLVDKKGRIVSSHKLATACYRFFELSKKVSYCDRNLYILEASDDMLPTFKMPSLTVRAEVDTPKLNARIKEIQEIFEEIEETNCLDLVNELLKDVQPLIDFVGDDKVLLGKPSDAKLIFNPLDIESVEEIFAVVEKAAKYYKKGYFDRIKR